MRSGPPRQTLIISALVVVICSLLPATASAEVRQLLVNPSSVAFGNVAVGTSKAVTETLTNNGWNTLTVRGVGSNNPSFQFSGCALPFSLAAGQSRSCSLVFTPTSAGYVSGTVTVYWVNAKGIRRAIRMPVSGTGVTSATSGTLSGSPSSLSFGTLQTGSSSTATESIANSGSAAVTISQVAISGSGFSFSGITPPVTLSAGQSVSVKVTYAPQSSGSVTGNLSISSNASNPTLTIPLAGSATSPGQLAVSPASASFGNVVVGTQNSQTASLTASGGPVTISSVGINGTEFSLSGINLPLSLAAGQSVPFTLTFAPQVVGSATGSFTFMTSASTSALESLSGSGVSAPQHSVTLNWSPSSSANVLGYYIYRGSQSGGPYTAVNSGIDASTNYVDGTVQGGQTYYYVVTSVDSTGAQSTYSNQVQAVIPYP